MFIYKKYKRNKHSNWRARAYLWVGGWAPTQRKKSQSKRERGGLNKSIVSSPGYMGERRRAGVVAMTWGAAEREGRGKGSGATEASGAASSLVPRGETEKSRREEDLTKKIG